MGNGAANRYLNGALQYLADEAAKTGTEFHKNEWVLSLCPPGAPKQRNGFDCGMFVVMFADFITDNLPLNFSQENFPLFRNKVCANILRKELNYPEYVVM